jgi:prophage endopeptidase
MIRYAAVALVAFGCAWYVQGLRWESDVKDAGIASANATVAAVDAINANLIRSRAETESIRATYLSEKEKANREIDDLERRVTAGSERLYIKAKCPAGVPSAGADASGTDAGAAELDAASTRTYLALERGLSEQYRLLQFCRSELKKRSAQSK